MKCAYLIMTLLCYVSSLTMVTVAKVTRLSWLSENLLTHQNHHFLDGDHCVCEGGGEWRNVYTVQDLRSYVFQGTAAWLLPSIQTTYTYVLATSATLFSRFHAVYYILVVSTAMCTMSNSNGNAPVCVDGSAYRVQSLPVLLHQSCLPPSDPFYHVSPVFSRLCLGSQYLEINRCPDLGVFTLEVSSHLVI